MKDKYQRYEENKAELSAQMAELKQSLRALRSAFKNLVTVMAEVVKGKRQ